MRARGGEGAEGGETSVYKIKEEMLIKNKQKKISFHRAKAASGHLNCQCR